MVTIYDYEGLIEEKRLIVTVGKKEVRFNWEGQTIKTQNCMGTQYFIELLLHPYQSISAVGLYSLYNHPIPTVYAKDNMELGLAHAGGFFREVWPQVDKVTRDSVKQRLNLIILQLAEAEEFNDIGRIEALRFENESLLDYLKDAISFQDSKAKYHSRDFKCERNVYKMLDNVLSVISRQCPSLGKLLRDCLQLWGELIFIPQNNLSVIVLQNNDEWKNTV